MRTRLVAFLPAFGVLSAPGGTGRPDPRLHPLGRFTRQEHAAVTGIALDGDRIRARWGAYDGAAFDVHHLSATFTLRHGALVASDVRRGRWRPSSATSPPA